MGSGISTDNGRLHSLTYANGDRYEGEMLNGVREGKGTYFYHNGDKYEGWWQGNKKNGMGTLYYKNGNLYVGQWFNSEKNGFGSFYYRSGDKYHGEFSNGKQEGRGKYISRDGSTYSGYFSQNQKDGKGIMYYSKGKVTKEVWESGILKSSKFIYEDEDEDDEDSGNNNQIRNIDNNDYFMDIPQIDFLTGNYMEQPAKCNQNQDNNCYKTNIFTLEVAKYFKARIPNNYFDAMEIVLNTNDLIYDNPKITEWAEDDVILWLKRIGIDKYDDIIEKNNINGIRFLKASYNELKTFKIDDVKDVKLILKSIDFLRIFVRLQLDFSDTLEHQNETTPMTNIVVNTQKIPDRPYSSAIPSKMPQWDISKRSISNSTLTMSHTNTVDRNAKDILPVPSPQNKNDSMIKEDKEEIVENVENAITKMAITKVLLHSLNLSGFNFYINFSELEIGRKIGEGGFGRVHIGLWNKKEVAIKIFSSKEKLNLKNVLNKFIKEINIISNLRHPNIVLYIGSSVHKDNYYMVTENISKGSLFDYLHNSNNTLNEKNQIRIAYQIAIAMRYLHSRNITHCDMKSSNILLNNDYNIKLSDFGLSRMVNILNLNEVKGKFGTIHWMPPEIMRAKKYEEASDVFSYGMILWEMMTGKIPYHDLEQNQIVALVADYGKIVEVPRDGNIALQKLIKHCLFYQPEKRPTFEAIVKFLEKVYIRITTHDYVSDEIIQYLS